MEIYFSNNGLEKICADVKKMNRKLGTTRAALVVRRITELSAATTLQDLAPLPGPRCHELKGTRQGQLSVDLDHPHRLIFTPAHNPVPTKDDGGLDWSAVTAVTIDEIDDTH